MLDWLKRKLYLDSISDKAKTRKVMRGEVYECDFGIGIGSERQKIRPCVIIQGNVGNINSSNVIVAPITHTEKSIPSMAKIDTQINELNQEVILDGCVNLSNIQTVSKVRLGNYITKLNKNDINRINDSILVSLGLIKNFKELNNKIEKQQEYIKRIKDNLTKNQFQKNIKKMFTNVDKYVIIQLQISYLLQVTVLNNKYKNLFRFWVFFNTLLYFYI